MISINVEKELNSPFGKMNLMFSQNIEQGELVTLFGKSGAGKTTTLRIIAGLQKPDIGKIQINEKVLLDTSKKISIPPQKRNISLVFQNYALFPNMNILDNLSFALQKNQNKKILTELIEIMELGELQNQFPAQLSGGQQQRVAFARALVQQPKLLLLD